MNSFWEILNKQELLKVNLEDWTKAKELSDKRLPAFNQLKELMVYAASQPFEEELKPQFDSILTNCSLLDDPDPLPLLIKTLVDHLRQAITDAANAYSQAYEAALTELEETESWKKLDER